MLREIAITNAQNHHPIYTSQSAAREAQLRLQQGRLEQAILWAESCGLKTDDAKWPYARTVEYLALARVLIAKGTLEGVESLLHRLCEAAESNGRAGDLIEILIQLALYCQAVSEKEGAFQFIERALTLAEREGFVRSFVDEGESVRLLLVDYQSSVRDRRLGAIDGNAIRLLTYTDRLLAASSKDVSLETIDPISIPESLSERELDVLRLIATGRSNQEIADILVIALSTVKSHINNLYGKLGTKRRTQAIATAREMGLLSE